MRMEDRDFCDSLLELNNVAIIEQVQEHIDFKSLSRRAADKGCWEICMKLCEKYPRQVDVEHILKEAAAYGRIGLVKYIVENHSAAEVETAALVAAKRNELETVQYLVEGDNTLYLGGYFSRYYAKNVTEILITALDNHACQVSSYFVNSSSVDSEKILYYYVQTNKHTYLENLLERQKFSFYIHTQALCKAIVHNSVTCAKTLSALKNVDLKKSLHLACILGRDEIVKDMLRRSGVSKELWDKFNSIYETIPTSYYWRYQSVRNALEKTYKDGDFTQIRV